MPSRVRRGAAPPPPAGMSADEWEVVRSDDSEAEAVEAEDALHEEGMETEAVLVGGGGGGKIASVVARAASAGTLARREVPAEAEALEEAPPSPPPFGALLSLRLRPPVASFWVRARACAPKGGPRRRPPRARSRARLAPRLAPRRCARRSSELLARPRVAHGRVRSRVRLHATVFALTSATCRGAHRR
jgi:hypothetical protein